MKLEAAVMESNDKDEFWSVLVDIQDGDKKFAIDVELNPDTICCRRAGATFKTYAWKGSSVTSNAARAAIDYISQ